MSISKLIFDKKDNPAVQDLICEILNVTVKSTSHFSISYNNFENENGTIHIMSIYVGEGIQVILLDRDFFLENHFLSSYLKQVPESRRGVYYNIPSHILDEGLNTYYPTLYDKLKLL